MKWWQFYLYNGGSNISLHLLVFFAPMQSLVQKVTIIFFHWFLSWLETMMQHETKFLPDCCYSAIVRIDYGFTTFLRQFRQWLWHLVTESRGCGSQTRPGDKWWMRMFVCVCPSPVPHFTQGDTSQPLKWSLSTFYSDLLSDMKCLECRIYTLHTIIWFDKSCSFASLLTRRPGSRPLLTAGRNLRAETVFICPGIVNKNISMKYL